MVKKLFLVILSVTLMFIFVLSVNAGEGWNRTTDLSTGTSYGKLVVAEGGMNAWTEGYAEIGGGSITDIKTYCWGKLGPLGPTTPRSGGSYAYYILAVPTGFYFWDGSSEHSVYFSNGINVTTWLIGISAY